MSPPSSSCELRLSPGEAYRCTSEFPRRGSGRGSPIRKNPKMTVHRHCAKLKEGLVFVEIELISCRKSTLPMAAADRRWLAGRTLTDALVACHCCEEETRVFGAEGRRKGKEYCGR